MLVAAPVRAIPMKTTGAQYVSLPPLQAPDKRTGGSPITPPLPKSYSRASTPTRSTRD